jgi:ribose 5-phosphate isomerase B
VLVKIAFGTDETTHLTQGVVVELSEMGHDILILAEGDAWPDVGRQVGEAVASGAADRGIAMCFTGTGVSMAANKVPGVRAALCTDAETARGARRWNDANVLVMGLRLATPATATEMIVAFLSTEPDDDERPQFTKLQ